MWFFPNIPYLYNCVVGQIMWFFPKQFPHPISSSQQALAMLEKDPDLPCQCGCTVGIQSRASGIASWKCSSCCERGTCPRDETGSFFQRCSSLPLFSSLSFLFHSAHLFLYKFRKWEVVAAGRRVGRWRWSPLPICFLWWPLFASWMGWTFENKKIKQGTKISLTNQFE